MSAPDAVLTQESGAVVLDPARSIVWRAAVARSSVELKSFFRNRQSLVFTLLLPIVLLVVLGSIFSGTVPGTHTDFKQMFIAGIIACGVMSVSFNGLAISVAIERDTGMIRRLASSPMPKSAYFIGKVVRVAVTGTLETLLLLAVAVPAFGLPLPSTAARWETLVWVLLLGAVACTLLAVAFSSIIPNARSASAIVTLPFLVLQFISGVFFPYSQLPAWMQTVAALFPLKWMTQGLRSVFLPGDFARVEPAGVWELDRVALVLAAWCLAGLVLSFLTFRWRGPNVR
ncbi:ABC-2 type transport system permease protein [Microbispora rosea]|uniref:Transport permease protein n=1 Tax=Microbispora rosea TaxID=58117 RepID=A0A1N7DBI0_9ACTN|nr:ABC transporter permease [Microbispora rosea]GIH49397.1 transport permease protein [Microbispora rosea subsp. rosea]SIR73107.1 ABC-2 type transport system permease protein [Microbispora rosea]